MTHSRMDGHEFTRQVRKAESERVPGGPRTPIVAVTANMMKGEEERCIAIGMDAYGSFAPDRYVTGSRGMSASPQKRTSDPRVNAFFVAARASCPRLRDRISSVSFRKIARELD
jgi:CheY-like chemotaxis protein